MPDQPASVDAAVLSAFVPLSGLNPDHLEELSRSTELVDLPEGHQLVGDDRRPGLSFYLLEGELELRSRAEDEGVLHAGSDDARFTIPGPAQGYTSVRARTPVRLIGVDRPRVSTLLILAQAPHAPGGVIPADTWAVRLLQSELFARVPAANVERIFELMGAVQVTAGDVVVEQGSPGEHYYVVRDGDFEVNFRPAADGEPVHLADLSPGDTFGEEALVSGALRNATVRSTNGGTVLRLTKDDFVHLIQNPLLDSVDRERAEDLIRAGARWLDTRLPEEYAKNGIESSLNIPLSQIRERATELDPEIPYVVYCNAGRRSAAAAFVLNQLGYHASVLDGGLLDDATGRAARRPTGEGTDLQAALLEADEQLEDALRQKAEVEASRRIEPAPEGPADAQTAQALHARKRELEEQSLRATESLAQARRRKLALEERLRAAEAQAATQRRRAQESIERLREEADARLREEEERLHAEYTQAATEMKRIASARAEAEEHFVKERERLEAELEQARERMEADVKRIRAEMQSAKEAAQARAANIQRDRASAETKVREETESRLRDERKRLESEFAMSVAAQDKAKHDLDAAEQAIASTQAEAEHFARRIREARDAREAAEQERQAAERERLARERERAAAELAAAEREKREAEEALKSSRPAEEKPPRETVEEATPEVASAEAKIAEANVAVESARAAKAEADYASTRAEALIAVQREVEEELRLQLVKEAEEWLLDERSRSEAELDQADREAKRVDEINDAKDRSRRAAHDANESLLGEVQSQLGGEMSESAKIIEESLRQREFAEEKASLAKRAQEDATAERLRAEAALNEIRRKMAGS